MPLHVMANFGGFLCECGLEGNVRVSLLIMLCYFGDAFVMQYVSPINLLKASLVVYGKRLTICVQCTLLVLVSGYHYHKRPILLR